MRNLGFALLILLALVLPVSGQESYKVIVVAPGYQSELGLRKDLESMATQFDHVVVAQNLNQVLETLRKIGSKREITRLVFLGHGYLGDKKTGGIIDLGEDINASNLAAQKEILRKQGDSKLLDAFAANAEIVYFNCHAGLNPEFLKETAELFLGFSGGTVYGSEDEVFSKLSAGNQLLALLNRFGLVGEDSISFESPSQNSYLRFPSHEIKGFLWRTVKPETISIKGKSEVPVHSRIWLEGAMPSDWLEGAYRPYIKIRWLENRQLLGDKPTQEVEFPKIETRSFTLEVFLDNGVGARKLGTTTHAVKVVERKTSATQKPDPPDPPSVATEFAVTGPSQAAYSEVVALEAEVPQEMAGRSAKIVWFYGAHDSAQEMVFSQGLPGVPGPLASPGGSSEPQAHGSRILVQPQRGNAKFFAALKDATGKVVARSPVHNLHILEGKFQVTCPGKWTRSEGSSFTISRDATLDFDEANTKGRVWGHDGGAIVSIRWLSYGEGPPNSEISPKIQTTGGFSGNGRYFVKGLARFEVDTELPSLHWSTGDAATLWQKWNPVQKKHHEQARKDTDALIASIRVGQVESLAQGAGSVSVPTPGTDPVATAPPTTPPSEPVAAEPDLKAVETLAKNDDYEGAQSTLSAYPQTPVVKKELALVNDWLTRAGEIRQLAALVEKLVSEKKLPSALKLILRISEITNRPTAMKGGTLPESERAEKAYHLKKVDYDKDWLDYSYQSGQLFTQMNWEALVELAQRMLTWEMFPGGDEQVRVNLAQAEAGLKAQSAAWAAYQEADREAASGQLEDAQWRSRALQSLDFARTKFYQQDPRWAEISGLINRIKGYSGPFSVRVEPATCQLSPGGEIQTVAHATGGVPPYSFEWFVGTERSGTINQVKAWKLNQAGRYQLRVVATDSTGRKAEAACLAQVSSAQVSQPVQSPSVVEAPDPTGYRVTGGKATMGSRYEPNCKGNPFADGYWCSSRGGSDWLQNQLDAFHLVHEVRVELFSSDVSTDGMTIQIKAHTPKGWILVEELRNTNINKAVLTGGAKAHSVGPTVFALSPPQRVDAVRLEIAGHGWFEARNIQIWATGSASKTTQAPVDVSVARTSNFVGNFVISDPARTTDKYHGTLRLLDNGHGKSREWLNNKPVKPKYPETADAEGQLPIVWSYDASTQTFVLDWSVGGQLKGLGRFSGKVQGNTNDFTLSGQWVSGKAGKIRIVRQ